MPRKRKTNDDTPDQSQVINWYSSAPNMSAYMPTYHNPSYNDTTMPLQHPLRMIICGSSGSGKTNLALSIIRMMDSTFNKIRIYTANQNEPLYLYLKEKLMDLLEIHDGLDHLRGLNIDTAFDGQELVIIDDLCNEKDQKKIEDLFIRGRKLSTGGAGVSLMYLTQSYYKVPRIIRLQCDGIILKKLGSNRDVKSVCDDHSPDGLQAKELLRMYNYCVPNDDVTNFLFIDKKAPNGRNFRRGFRDMINSQAFKIE